MSFRTVVVDDEGLARRRVRDLVAGHSELELVGEAAGGEEALDIIVATAPDLVFLDIRMPEPDGFQVVASLDEASVPAIVFVTAYDDHAVRAFEVGAVDYLLKPVAPERFEAAVARILARMAAGEQARAAREVAVHMDRERGYATRLVAQRGGKHYFVRVADVDWVAADGNYLRIRAGERQHLVRHTMKEAEAKLDPTAFVRIHRSTMVAVDRVRTIETGEYGDYVVTMEDGARFRSSRAYAERVRSLLR